MADQNTINTNELAAKNSPPELTVTVGSDCLLTGSSPQLEKHLKADLTINNPKYLDAVKYGRWVGKNFKKQLQFYEQVGRGILLPRGYTRQVMALCNRFMGVPPTIIDNRRSLPEIDLTFSGELRSYQREAVSDILGGQFGVLEAGTGSGKTIMALAVIAARRQPTLIIVHTRELFYQWCERIEQFLTIPPGMIGSGHFDIQPVTVGIVNSVRNRIDALKNCFGHLCVDECHRVPASLFTDVVKQFDSLYMLGLSATAFRREDGLTRLIYLYLGELAHKIESSGLEAKGMILKPQFIQLQTGFTYPFRDDYQAMISALTRDEGRNRQIVDDITAEIRKGAEGTILVVSDRVSHCERIIALLKDRQVHCAMLTGQVPQSARTEIVRQVQTGSIQVLVATLQLIGEGFDCSDLTTLFLTTPIKFSGRLVQVVGRILRPAAGKQPKVIDYVDPIGVLQHSARTRMKTYL